MQCETLREVVYGHRNKTRKKTVAAGRRCFSYHRCSSLFSIRLVPALLSNQNNTALTAAGFIMPDGAVEVMKNGYDDAYFSVSEVKKWFLRRLLYRKLQKVPLHRRNGWAVILRSVCAS